MGRPRTKSKYELRKHRLQVGLNKQELQILQWASDRDPDESIPHNQRVAAFVRDAAIAAARKALL